MKLVLQTDNGRDLQEFTIPECTIDVTDEQAIVMGRVVTKRINELMPELIEYEKKLLKSCTCFWKDKTLEERKYFRHHSSECGVWEMD